MCHRRNFRLRGDESADGETVGPCLAFSDTLWKGCSPKFVSRDLPPVPRPGSSLDGVSVVTRVARHRQERARRRWQGGLAQTQVAPDVGEWSGAPLAGRRDANSYL
jgi:hypothetical protein